MLTLIRSKRGQTTTEYALIVGGVALAMFIIFKNSLDGMIRTGLGQLGNRVTNGIAGYQVPGGPPQ